MVRFVWLAVWCVAGAAWAGDDAYRSRAKAEMSLEFDMDEVEAQMREPAPSAARSAAYGPPQAALPLRPNSKLDAVVVFRDRALVTRLLAADVPAGAGSVTFTGLPLGLNADGLQAQTRAGEGRITGVTLEGGASLEAAEARKVALKGEIRPLLDELGRIRDRLESLLAQRDYLLNNLLVPADGDRPVPTVDQARGMLTFLGDAERDLATRIRAERDLAEEVEEKLRPLLVQLSDPLATGQSVRVDLDVAKAGKVTVALRYQVTGATWSPSYNARLDEGSGKVTLEYFGIVEQRTGEAWTDTTLALSTADPNMSGDLPVISAWYLGRDSFSVSQSLQSRSGFANGMDNRAQMPMEAEAPYDDVGAPGGIGGRKGGGTVVFEVAGRRSVPGDGSSQRIPIGQQAFPTTIELSAVPRQVPAVYRRGRLRYEGQAPILPGPVSTFVGGDFVGSGALNGVLPGEEFKLSFGTDDRFRVQRQLVSRTVDYLGAGKKMVRYTFVYRTTVSSFAAVPLEVLVADQVPVAELDRVTVEVLTSSGALPPQADDPPGILRWKPTVAPGGKAVIDLKYTVTFPREDQQSQDELNMMY